MTNEEFQRWLAGVEQLTTAQRERLQQVAQEQWDEAAALAAIELRVDERRHCLRGRRHPIQTVNQRHRQLQQFLLPFHGVATKCLGNHLRWHQEIGLASQPSPRARLPGTPNAHVSRIEPFEFSVGERRFRLDQ